MLDGHEVVVLSDSPLLPLFRTLKPLLDEGNIPLALRELDRAWRLLPEQAMEIAPIYARAQIRDGRNPRVALKLLERCLQYDPTPEVEAEAIGLFQLMGRMDVAVRRVDAALQRYALIPGSPLALAAESVVSAMNAAVRGQVGLASDLKICAEAFVQSLSPVVFEIRDGTGALLARSEVTPSFDGHAICSMPLDAAGYMHWLRITANGQSLPGGDRPATPDFDVDGRASTRGGSVLGWVHLGWNPGVPVDLLIKDEIGNQHRFQADQRGQRSRWNFQLDLRKNKLSGGRLDLSVLLPDGSTVPLPDSPLLLKSELEARLERLTPSKRVKAIDWGRRRRPRPLDIIVPVYQGRDETLACIESICRTAVGDAHSIIVIDDASPDPALSADLDDLAAAGRITLLRNPANLGFSATVNRGMALHPEHDAVLVNADVVVFGDWLARLRNAAYSAPNIGTVTPFCDDDSIAGHAVGRAEDVSAGHAEVYDRFASSAYRGKTVEIPVGVGFCQYLRRDCWQDTGPLDDAVFGKGYGEESDYCMRARRRDWTHVLAADVYVHHAGGRSFGKRRAALQERAIRLMNLRHEGYDRYVGDFLKADPLHDLKRGFDEHRLAINGSPFVLIMTLSLKGGVDRFVRERVREITESGRTALILRAHELTPDVCMLWSSESFGLYLQYDIPQQLSKLQSLFSGLRIDSIEFHHFLGLDQRVVSLALELGAPYDVYVHDYSWICPRITLIDETGAYCGEPDVQTCERCVRKNGTQLQEKISVRALRRRSEIWLAGARRVIAPSQDVAKRLARYMPDLAVDAIAPEASSTLPLTLRPVGSGVIRVALLGGIGRHKGFHVLRECAEDAAARNLNLEFVIIGTSQDDDPLYETGKVFVTGEYRDAEIVQLLKREAPHVILLPSVWPETWCYTLSHALATGLPIVAFDLGAIAERLRAERRGLLLPLGIAAGELNDQLVQIALGNIPEQGVLGLLETQQDDEWQNQLQVFFKQLTIEDEEHMSELAKIEKAEKQQPADLRASAHAVTFPTGLYMFSVKTAAPAPVAKAGNLPFPALLVAGGPGLAVNAVEFVGSPKSSGTWLYNTGDTLVVKIGEGGATLVLTSIRAEGTQPLDVKVDRLDGAQQTPITIPQPAAGAAAPQPAAATTQATMDTASSALPPGIKLQGAAHLRQYGDVQFPNNGLIGRPGSKAWIEAFSIAPMEQLSPSDLEYKGLAANGFETPWLSDGALCGSRGKGIPLIGFAIRLKAGAAALYDCEYSASFLSGAKVGPFRGGVPCRSRTASDPLEALQLRIVKRPELTAVVVREKAPAAAASKGPRFSKFREDPAEAKAATTGVSKAAPVKSAPAKTAPPPKSAKPAPKATPVDSGKKPVKATPPRPAAKSKKGAPPSKSSPKRK